MNDAEHELSWLTEARAAHEATLTPGTRVVVDLGECPHVAKWHGTIEQGVTGDILGIDIEGSGAPEDHRFWVMFDWPIRARRSWYYAAYELTPIPRMTKEEIEAEVRRRL